MLRVIETVVRLQNLKKPLTLLHITDLHLTRADERDNEYVHWLSTDRKNYFPKAEDTFEALKQYMMESPPDYTILTGDIIDFPSEKNLDTFTGFLNDYCGNYLYTPGNHDWWYQNENPDEKTRTKYYPKFYPITHGKPDFQVVDAGGILLIGLDNTCYQITALQLQKLKAEFKKGIPCILCFHIPVYINTLTDDVVKVWKQPIMIGTPTKVFPGKMLPALVPTKETREFCELIAKEDSPVAAVISGHVHFAHEDSFGKNRVQYITPYACLHENCDGFIRRIRLVSE